MQVCTPQQWFTLLEMDMLLRGLLLFVVCTSAKSQMLLSITPNKVDVEDDLPVTIRCSLNLRNTKTDRVYSIMLLRRDMTIVVLFDSRVDQYLPGEPYNTHGVLNGPDGVAFLQLKLRNLTCKDRGDYSCKMAARRNSNNVQLGPTISPLTVIGSPSPIQVQVQPSRTSTAVEQAVNITCSALKKTQGSDWLWNLKGVSNQISTESCSYNENMCLYRCSSCMSCTVEAFTDSLVQCGYDGRIKRFSLNTSTNTIEGTISETETTTNDRISTERVHPLAVIEDAAYTDATSDVYPFQNESEKGDLYLLKNILVYSFISVFGLLFIVILWLFISDHRRCRRFRRSEYFMARHSERASKRSRDPTYLYPDTKLLHKQTSSYEAGQSSENGLLHHEFHQVHRQHASTDECNMVPSQGNRTLHNGHFADTNFMIVPRHVDMTNNLHSVDTNFMILPHHVDMRRIQENSSDTNSFGGEHIYDEVDDVRPSVGVPTVLVNSVGDRSETT